jgi:hypothetical protein
LQEATATQAQRATDQVNSTFSGDRGGHDSGPGGHQETVSDTSVADLTTVGRIDRLIGEMLA